MYTYICIKNHDTKLQFIIIFLFRFVSDEIQKKKKKIKKKKKKK